MAVAASKAPTGEVSVTFRLGKGYDNLSSTTSGSAEYVAGLLGIEEPNGKLSQILAQAITVDKWLQAKYEETNPGKA